MQGGETCIKRAGALLSTGAISRDRSETAARGGSESFQVVERNNNMSLGTILIIILILVLIGALPTWPYSSGWGYYPSGGLGLIVLIIVILVLMGRI